MKRSRLSLIGFYVLGPVVLILIIASFCFVFLAMAENDRLGKATDQIVTIVSVARYMPFSPNSTADHALAEFYEQATKRKALTFIQIEPATSESAPVYGLKNPWGGDMKIGIVPNERSFSIETAVSSAACRKILLLYAKDMRELGIKRVEIKENSSERRLWRQTYADGQANFLNGFPVESIYAGCGEGLQNLLRLTFSL